MEGTSLYAVSGEDDSMRKAKNLWLTYCPVRNRSLTTGPAAVVLCNCDAHQVLRALMTECPVDLKPFFALLRALDRGPFVPSVASSITFLMPTKRPLVPFARRVLCDLALTSPTDGPLPMLLLAVSADSPYLPRGEYLLSGRAAPRYH